MNVIPNHTFETLKDLRNSLKFYERDPVKYKEAKEQEEIYYREVLKQTLN